MTDESHLGVNPKDGGSSLSLSRASSSLVARGRRDAAAIAQRASGPIDPLSETRRLAEQGDAEAQSSLGYAYYRGTGVLYPGLPVLSGVAPDYAEAVKWFSKAAEQDDFDAREMLLFEFPREYAEAATKWFREAAEQGHAEGQYILATAYRAGSGVPRDHGEAVKWLRKAADQGHPWAQHDLAAAYSSGQGVPQDCAEAVKWYRRTADQGNPNAQFSLGCVYDNGQGAEQDDTEAVRWYRKAADQGLSAAQFNLGCMYLNGRGVVRDHIQAYMWMDLAAAHSYGDDEKRCAAGRDGVAAKMNPEQIAEAQRRAREWTPSTSDSSGRLK